jgi:aspartyl/asparaginyl beta-hydroxylase (cupin superfamily)
MNRIEEYLDSLDKKNLFMLYFSIVILAAIFYYYVNIGIFGKKIEENNLKIDSLEMKLTKNRTLEKKVAKLKKEYKLYQQKLLSSKEDLKYLSLLIATSDVLKINDKKFIEILNRILDAGIENAIAPSYEITTSDDKFKKYVITLKGNFYPEEYRNFMNYISEIEKINSIKTFDFASFKEDNATVSFRMKIIFWGIK